MAVTDYNKQKKLDVDSVSGTPTVDKATPVIIASGDDSTTGNGDIIIDFSNVKKEADIAVYDENDNLLSYEIESFSKKQIDDFEDDNITGWTGDTGNFTSQSGTVLSGSFSGELKADGANNAVQSPTVGFGANSLRFKTRSSTNTTGNSDFARIETYGDGTRLGYIELDDGSGDIIWFNGSDNVLRSWSQDTTYQFELNYNFGNSEVEILIDGTSQGTFSLEASPSNQQVDRVDLVNNTSNTGVTRDLFIDDIFLDDGSDSGVLWVYDSWVRDGSTQAKVVYGDGPASSEEGSASDIWGNTGQNAIGIYHFNQSSSPLLDSSPNNNDELGGQVTSRDASSSTSGHIGKLYEFDGIDDYINIGDHQTTGEITIVSVHERTGDSSRDTQAIITKDDFNTGEREYLYFGRDGGSNADTYDTAVNVTTDGFSRNNGYGTYVTGEVDHAVMTYDDDSSTDNFNFYENASVKDTRSLNGSLTDANRKAEIGRAVNGNYFFGFLSSLRIFGEDKSGDWVRADFDASPKAGQVFFTQQAAESTVTVQTVSVPASNGSATTVNPLVSPSGQATVNTVTNTVSTQSLNPQVQPQTATVNATTSTASTQSLNPQVTPQTATVQTPVSTGTGNSINPAVTGTGITSIETSVNQAQSESLNPSVEPQTVTVATPVNTANAESINPVVTTSLIVNVPTSTANTSNPEPGVNPSGQATVQTQVNQTTASNPEPTVSPGIVQVQTSVNQTQAKSLNPETSATGTASIQTAVNNLIADSINPAIDPTTITIQTSTNNATTESLTPQVTPGTATIQTTTNQVTGQSINPDVVLFRELDFEAPTKAIINKPNRFVTMQSRTFKTNDLGDELSAKLKDENGALDLSQGVSSVTLLMRDLKGNKVLDQEVNITDGANGEIEYEWSSNDTPIQEPGAYQAEFEILDTRDNAETVPNDGFLTIETEDDING